MRTIEILLIVLLVINAAGCAELRRKFTRKKQPKREPISFYRVEEYQPKNAHERYQDHYVFWRNWHLDLERTDGSSFRKDMTAMDESLRHLTAMRDLLRDEKAKELDAQIAKLELIREKMKSRKRDVMKDVHSRRTIERAGRIVVNNFSYNMASEYIKDSYIEADTEESEVK